MFKHKALALDGVGFGHRVMSILGTRWFDIEVVVTPSSGGSPWFPVEDYLITVRVKTKQGKVYQSSYRATDHGLSHIIRVAAAFKSVINLTGVISISIKNKAVKVKNIITSVFVK